MTGTNGRTVIGEVVLTNRKIMRALKESDIVQARRNWIFDGGNPMQRHALSKIGNGLIDPREVETLLGDLDLFKNLTDAEE